ncbi:Unknown protein [Striga hermonthica]|uniref:Uncharacterized protein n=1 Tax=Striga hermonthica TaxID=68872 RepID=A0A9N7NKD0_STRHE|nr:Unknown protein [Striga hermonthica]
MNISGKHNQAPVAYPAPPTSYPPPPADSYNGPYVMPPPPIGYPTKENTQMQNVPLETTSKGDGFFKGW